MKKIIIYILINLSIISVSNAQAPEQNPKTITVKGNYVDTYPTTWPNGETEYIIACICSESVCYTITINNIAGGGNNGGNLDSDCVGTGVDFIPYGANIKLSKADSTLLFEGIFLSFSNYPIDGNPLNRNSRFILQ